MEPGSCHKRQKVEETWGVLVEPTTLFQRTRGRQRKRPHVLVLCGLRPQRIRQSLSSLLPCLCHGTLSCGSFVANKVGSGEVHHQCLQSALPRTPLVPSTQPCGCFTVAPTVHGSLDG